ncbi:MAG: hypothetical protein IJX87_05435 [Clostridia bacterium]|nr:hypothetical protein [Clostridia bacterium]
MKKTSVPQEAKIFKYRFTPTLIVLAIAVIALCVAGIAVSIYQISRFGIREAIELLKYPFLTLISLFCIVLMIAILIKSQYCVDEKYLTTQFGFIKSKTEIQSITGLILDTDTYKLTVQMGEEFAVLSLSKEWNEDFTRALLDVNPKIDYSFTLAETDGKKKKK